MNKLDLFKIDEICIKCCIGYDQMGIIIPRIYDLLTDDNQEEIFDFIGKVANKTCCNIPYIIELVKENWS